MAVDVDGIERDRWRSRFGGVAAPFGPSGGGAPVSVVQAAVA